MTVELVDWQLMDDAPFKKNAKYADLYSIPDTWVGELIDGDLYAFPRPRSTHGRLVTRLGQQLERSDNERPEGWIILTDVEIWFGKHLLVPDACGWRRSRMPEMPDVATFRLAPDWVCEGLSPSTARLDKGRKREIYEKAGVGHVWYADPALHTIDVFVLENKQYKLVASVGGDKRVKLAPFTHAIDLAKLWQR